MRTQAILSAVFGGFRRKGRARSGGILSGLLVVIFIVCTTLTAGCTTHTIGNAELARNVYVELVDWHVSGLWIFNTPICWIRVVNYNDVPVKDVRVRFKTFGYNGELLSNGTYTMEGSVGPRSVKNFVEQTVGLVDIESDMLSIELDAVEADQ
jgi:hypothetical protein